MSNRVARYGKRVGYTDAEMERFHVQCPDAGVDCMGYGKVTAQVRVVPRVRG